MPTRDGHRPFFCPRRYEALRDIPFAARVAPFRRVLMHAFQVDISPLREGVH